MQYKQSNSKRYNINQLRSETNNLNGMGVNSCITGKIHLHVFKMNYIWTKHGIPI